jgi:hypothetical protein
MHPVANVAQTDATDAWRIRGFNRKAGRPEGFFCLGFGGGKLRSEPKNSSRLPAFL